MLNCPNCSAPMDGRVCTFCGAALNKSTKSDEELRLLDQYHDELQSKSTSEQKRMLRNGYLPTTDVALVEAGIRCVALIENAVPTKELSYCAGERLKQVVKKLRELDTSSARQALPELERHLKTHKWVYVASVVIMVVLSTIARRYLQDYFGRP